MCNEIKWHKVEDELPPEGMQVLVIGIISDLNLITHWIVSLDTRPGKYGRSTMNDVQFPTFIPKKCLATHWAFIPIINDEYLGIEND